MKIQVAAGERLAATALAIGHTLGARREANSLYQAPGTETTHTVRWDVQHSQLLLHERGGNSDAAGGDLLLRRGGLVTHTYLECGAILPLQRRVDRAPA